MVFPPNDIVDAEAIAEVSSRLRSNSTIRGIVERRRWLRPTMRFVAVKSAQKQASGMAFKTRDLLSRQRTRTINALRGHLTEYGVVAPLGMQNLPRLGLALADADIPAETGTFAQ